MSTERQADVRPGETACDGCIHGPKCRVVPCAECGAGWHHLGLIPNPFVCSRCD